MHASRQGLRSSGRGMQFDVGTLWTLERNTHVARCALVWLPQGWELRVLIDDDALLSERCRTQLGVFAVAGAWRARLREAGWDELSEPRPSLSGAQQVAAPEPAGPQPTVRRRKSFDSEEFAGPVVSAFTSRAMRSRH